ncbi:MAG: SIMPL domain-containing protein [Myxococcota bacterium]
MRVEQAVANPCGIAVLGTSICRVPPDHAIIRCTVERTDHAPGAAFEQARVAAASVRGAFERLGVAEVKTSRISLSQDRRWDPDQKQQIDVGYTARLSFQAAVQDLDTLETVLVDIIEAGANRLDGVAFETSMLGELRAQARRQAVENGRSKAEHYARAAGVALGRLLHLEDTDPKGLRGREEVTRGGASDAVDPGWIEVGASVHLTFKLER